MNYLLWVKKMATLKRLPLIALVELTGVEPVSKHDIHKLSTCLFRLLIVGKEQGTDKPTISLAGYS